MAAAKIKAVEDDTVNEKQQAKKAKMAATEVLAEVKKRQQRQKRISAR